MGAGAQLAGGKWRRVVLPVCCSRGSTDVDIVLAGSFRRSLVVRWHYFCQTSKFPFVAGRTITRLEMVSCVPEDWNPVELSHGFVRVGTLASDLPLHRTLNPRSSLYWEISLTRHLGASTGFPVRLPGASMVLPSSEPLVMPNLSRKTTNCKPQVGGVSLECRAGVPQSQIIHGARISWFICTPNANTNPKTKSSVRERFLLTPRSCFLHLSEPSR